MQRMKPTRRLLKAAAVDEGGLGTIFSPSATELSPVPVSQPINGSTETTTRRPLKQPTSTLDSSMALTILVLLTALFFMGFFSIYIRRFADHESTDVRRRRNPSLPSSSAAGMYGNQKRNCADPSIVRSLPLICYTGNAKQPITDCPICLSEFEEKEIVKLIPFCGHVYHPPCIDAWLGSHVSCPLCRSTQFFKKVDEEVCLDVKDVEGSNNDGSRLESRGSTAGDDDTWREVGPVGVRRISSCTSLSDHVALTRSLSF